MKHGLERPAGELANLGQIGTERQIAILALGMVHALRSHRLTIEEAWNELFNVSNYERLKERRCDKRLLKMFAWAMELPNVEPQGEKALEESYDAIEKLAQAVLEDGELNGSRRDQKERAMKHTAKPRGRLKSNGKVLAHKQIKNALGRSRS